jgi:hypothetical protein
VIFRLLGHVLVCGVLHVAYQTPERVKGQYMICVLYKSCLVLATATRFFTPYSVVASISLANGSVEEPDNGRGEFSMATSRIKLNRRRSTMPHGALYLEADV